MADKTNLIIKILGDVKDVKKKLDTLDKRIKKTSKATQKFHASIKKGFMNFLKYTALIGTTIMALRKLTSAITSSLRVYAEQITAEAKLASVLKSTGRDVIPFLIDSYKDYAAEMQILTGFGDEVIINTQALMATFTQISDVVMPKAMDALLDVSAVMGQDLKQTAIQLGKALNDPILGVTALRRVGIQLTEQQTDSIKKFVELNDVASAQNIILQELKTQFGGAAIAMGETYAGKIKILKAAYGDLKEEMGRTMANAIEPMLPMTLQMVNNLKLWIEEKNNLREAYEKLKEPMEIVNDLTRLEIKQAEQTVEIHQLNRKEIELEGAIRSVMQHGNQEYIDTLKDELDTMRISIRRRAQLLDNLKAAIEARGDEEKEILDGIKVKDAEKKSIDDLISSTDEWANTIVMTGQEALFLREQVDSNIEATKNWNEEIDNTIDTLYKYNAATFRVRDVTAEVVEEVSEDWQDLFDRQVKAASDFVGAWNTAFDAIFSASDEFMNNRSIVLENDYQQQKQRILDNITDETAQKEALEELDKTFSAKRRKLAREQAERDKRQAIFGAVINTAMAVTKALGSAVPPLNFILAAIVAAAGALQTAAIVARPLPALQEGGIAIQDTLARIGEGGTREAVIPLSAEGLRPFAEAIVNELQRIGSPGRPIVNQGNTLVNVQVGTEPIIRTVQKAMDNQQLRVNAKAIR